MSNFAPNTLSRQTSWRPSHRASTYGDDDQRIIARRSTLEGNAYQGDPIRNSLASWQSEIDKLTPAQLKLFTEGPEPRSFHDYTITLQQAIQNRVDNGRIFGFAKHVRPIYDLVKALSPVVSAGSDFSPVPFSAVLGGITSILSISVRVDDYQAKLIDTLTSMAMQLKVLDKYNAASLFKEDPDIQASQTEVATDILKFCIATVQIFFDERGREKNGLLLALKTLWKDFDVKFGDIKAEFERHLAQLEQWRKLADSKQLRSVGQGIATMDTILTRRHAELMGLAKDQGDANVQRATEEKRRHVVSWLPSIPFTSVQEDNYERRMPGTGDWLMSHPQLQDWRYATESACLWIHGKPGSGKSHLAARVIHDLNQSYKDNQEVAPPVAYLYCSSTQLTTKMNLNKLLGSLLGQLYAKLPPGHDVESLSARAISAGKESASRSELKEWIWSAVKNLGSCFVVIDGLDECSDFEENQFKDLCNFIASLTTPRDEHVDSSAIVKAMVLSRPNYSIITHALSAFPQIPIDKGANDQDIKMYVSKVVDEIETDPSDEQREGYQDIKEIIFNHADGMFLWVQLKVKDFREIGNIEDIKEALEDTAEGLGDLYQQCIKRILDRSRFVRDRALKAILWVSNSYMRLSKVELLEALSVKSGRSGISDSQRLSRDLALCTECADLLVEVDGHYQLIHASLREFLISQSSLIGLYGDLQQHSDALLAETCLTYLTFDKLRSICVSDPQELIYLLQDYPFLEYASLFWGDHFTSANRPRSAHLNNLAKKFLESPLAIDLSIKILEFEEFCRDPFLVSGKPSELHILSIFNIWELASDTPDLECTINEHDYFNHLPLDYAIIYGSKEMAHWLLKAYTRDNDRDGVLFLNCYGCCQTDLLMQAARLGWVEILQSLMHLRPDGNNDPESSLSAALGEIMEQGDSLPLTTVIGMGADSNLRGRHGITPLMRWAPLVDTTKMLLNAGADVQLVDDFGYTALHFAALCGSSASMSLLIEAGAPIDAETLDGSTPLKCALKDHPLAATTLLDGGADIDHQSSSGWRAIHFASHYGSLEGVGVLLGRGANIDFVTPKDGASPLHLAAAAGHSEIVYTLLDHCDSPSFVDKRDMAGNTALTVALDRGFTDICQSLLENGATVDALTWVDDLPAEFFVELYKWHRAQSHGDSVNPAMDRLLQTLTSIAAQKLEAASQDDAAEPQDLTLVGETTGFTIQGLGEFILSDLKSSLAMKHSETSSSLGASLRYTWESDIYLVWVLLNVVLDERQIRKSLGGATYEDFIKLMEFNSDAAEQRLPIESLPLDTIEEAKETSQPADQSSDKVSLVEEETAQRSKDDTWTEITKDLVITESLRELGYDFEETRDFFYIKLYMHYDQVLELVAHSDKLKAISRTIYRKSPIERPYRPERQIRGLNRVPQSLTRIRDVDVVPNSVE